MAASSPGVRSPLEGGSAGHRVHLVDGTYELFRHFFAVPSHRDSKGREVGALRGVLGSLVGLLEEGATHVGVATDHVIESFRNDLYAGYKTGDGIDPELRGQFEPLEDALEAAGFTVWPMAEYEADDALAAAAAAARADSRVQRILLCTPDKDLAQCVSGQRVVMLDRRKRTVIDEDGVRAKFGVDPASIPDYLALVGDSSDGFPGLPGWGPKSAALVLARYRHLEGIPAGHWDVRLRGAEALAATLAARRAEALLYRKLATLIADGPAVGSWEDWCWRAPTPAFAKLAASLGAAPIGDRLEKLASARGAHSSRGAPA
jgi:5'-3' exonuclease